MGGGLLKGKDDEYGFYTKDGKIPLPPNAEADMILMAEVNGKIFYNASPFITTPVKSSKHRAANKKGGLTASRI